MSSLERLFRSRGVTLLDLGGAVTPRSFQDPRSEHLATRRALGLFDFSFMSLCEIAGGGAQAMLERLQTRALAAVKPGQLVYTLMLRDDGSVFIDATLWRHDDRWWLFTGRRGDVAWVLEHAAGSDIDVRERSGEFSVLALQGPSSGHALARLIGEPTVSALRYFHFAEANLAGARAVVARLGFSGELGYEVVVPATRAVAAWSALLDAGRGLGIVECGFEAVDSLRIEAGYVLFGQEIGRAETPLELDLARLVDPKPEDFAGKRALADAQRSPLARRLTGLEILDRPASSLQLPLARVTSECASPVLGKTIALGFAHPDVATRSLVRIADGRMARVVPLPFRDPERRLPRARPLGD